MGVEKNMKVKMCQKNSAFSRCSESLTPEGALVYVMLLLEVERLELYCYVVQYKTVPWLCGDSSDVFSAERNVNV